LFFSGIEFRWQTHRNIIYQCFEFIENSNDAFLFIKRRNRYKVRLKIPNTNMWHSTAFFHGMDCFLFLLQ